MCNCFIRNSNNSTIYVFTVTFLKIHNHNFAEMSIIAQNYGYRKMKFLDMFTFYYFYCLKSFNLQSFYSFMFTLLLNALELYSFLLKWNGSVFEPILRYYSGHIFLNYVFPEFLGFNQRFRNRFCGCCCLLPSFKCNGISS